MAKGGAPRHDPVPIGDVAAPPFALLSDPRDLFRRRAERLRSLAQGHELAPYLTFLADLCDAQAATLDRLPDPDLPDAGMIARAREFGMPPLDRNRFAADDPVFATTLARLLDSAGTIAMPEAARTALDRVRSADPHSCTLMVRSVLDDAIPVEAIAEHILVAAALQVHFSRLAANLDATALVEIGDGACPACGGPPNASLIVGWPGAHGTRFCACALCGTLWNYVRIKCTLCGETKGIAYQEIEGRADNVKAETCDSCRGYVKIMQQQREPALEPVADDVASLALDLLMREAGFRRGAVNPFLFGY